MPSLGLEAANSNRSNSSTTQALRALVGPRWAEGRMADKADPPASVASILILGESMRVHATRA